MFSSNKEVKLSKGNINLKFDSRILKNKSKLGVAVTMFY